ncbi:hypothetical protein V1477_020057 [Vespula maculifrons]|uniref:Uncharacterized protein n=1 Tax=Vespula maculifrons TaxID=7453 RepID=A0ABD2ALP0_VESMC
MVLFIRLPIYGYKQCSNVIFGLMRFIKISSYYLNMSMSIKLILEIMHCKIMDLQMTWVDNIFQCIELIDKLQDIKALFLLLGTDLNNYLTA